MNKTVAGAIFAVILAILLTVTPILTVYANEPEQSPIAITVIVPISEYVPAEAPEPTPVPRKIYPIHVWESRDNNRRELIRVYELREGESPAYITRESFERDGFRFELAEIVRREVPAHSVREHIETIEVSTQTSDLATVIRLLSPTLEYISEDGYIGVLHLDISSVRIESQGTRSNSRTVTRTREFPHLSNRDTSLIPRTISESGRTYTLSDVQWRNQSTTAIDYTQVGTTFTAVATYSRTATSVSTLNFSPFSHIHEENCGNKGFLK